MAKDNINGVAYNTKTAEAIARNGSGREIMHSDERWFNETLYRKKSGEFFLYGSSGIFTKYAKQTGPNSWERSEAILPLTEDEVREWAMNNLDDDGFRFVDIGSHVKNLKAFMALRDSDPVFDSVKNKGIGIPAFVHDDGTVTLIPEDVGLKSRQEDLLE